MTEDKAHFQCQRKAGFALLHGPVETTLVLQPTDIVTGFREKYIFHFMQLLVLFFYFDSLITFSHYVTIIHCCFATRTSSLTNYCRIATTIVFSRCAPGF